jgi:hypothetical protein
MTRAIGLSALGLGLLIGCARGPNVTTDQLPLRRVVVYRNGVGYFERGGRVDTDQVTFKMRPRMVGDFLATLAIVERGGSTVRSASFPIEVEEDVDPSAPSAEFVGMLEAWKEPQPRKARRKLKEVTLRLDGKEHDLAIGYVAATPVWRPSYRVVVHPNGQVELQSWGIVQNLSGEDWKDVELSLVAGAPLAFESTLGDPVLPERPVVTDTGEVIAAVPGGLTSLEERESEVERVGGAPAAERAPDEAYGYSFEDDAMEESARPGGSHSSGAARRMSPAAPGPAANAGAPPPPGKPQPKSPTVAKKAEVAREAVSPPRRMSALAAVAVQAGTTRYELPGKITVPDESATMVLLTSRRVKGEAVFLYAPDGGVPDSSLHPFRVVRFTNETKGLLERGPIAVFEKGAFLGQGLLEPLPPRGTATVPFSLERGLAVERELKYDQLGARLFKIEAGQLTIERDSVTRTIYRIKNGTEQKSKVVVRHPRVTGARLYGPPPGTEDNVGTGLALVPVEVKADGKTELTVDERLAVQQYVDWLSPLADEAVQAYLKDPRADHALADKLRDTWKIRQKLESARDEEQKLSIEQSELEKASRETRLSLQAIEKNNQAADLRAKLTKRLGEIQTRLEQLTKRLVEVRLVVNEQEVRFRDAVRELKLVTPPPAR